LFYLATAIAGDGLLQVVIGGIMCNCVFFFISVSVTLGYVKTVALL